jgi:type IV secretion system protein VirD4
MAAAVRGLHLGYFYDDETKRAGGRRTYQGDRHAIVFGPSGTGKTTRLLMVNLLSDCLADRSVIVIDPKAELAAVTAKFRYELGHDVKIIDPFGKLAEFVAARPDAYRYLIDNGLVESVGFDPLAALDPGTLKNRNPNFYDDAAAIGEALIKIEGKEPHWSESAQGLMTGLVMWEMVRPKEGGDVASLENVRRLLTEADQWGPLFDEDDGRPVIGGDGKQIEVQTHGLAATARRMVKDGGYEIASLAGRFTERTDELASIQSTADTQTRWLLSTRIRDDLKKPGVDFSNLKKQPTTVFVILPAERMRTHAVWLRLIIVSALRALYTPGGLRTMMLIDEMAALGRLAPLEDAFGLVRGYGVQIAGYLQDMGQLKALYEDRWESFLANAGVVQGLTPNDLLTADWMSRRSGQATVSAKGISENVSASGETGQGTSWQQVGRPKFLPYEVLGLGEGMGLYWLAGLAESVRFFAPYYDKMDDCEPRASRNPYRSG